MIVALRLLRQKWTDCQIPDADGESNSPTDTEIVQGRHEFFLRRLIDFDEFAFELQVRIGWDRSLVPLVAISLVGRDFDGSLAAHLHSLESLFESGKNLVLSRLAHKILGKVKLGTGVWFQKGGGVGNGQLLFGLFTDGVSGTNFGILEFDGSLLLCRLVILKWIVLFDDLQCKAGRLLSMELPRGRRKGQCCESTGSN